MSKREIKHPQERCLPRLTLPPGQLMAGSLSVGKAHWT